MKIAYSMWIPMCQQILLPFFSCCLLFLLVWALNDGERRKSGTNHASPSGHDAGTICTGDLLDQRQHRYEKKGGDNNRFMSNTGACRLVPYTTDRIVPCLDFIHNQKQLAGNFDDSPLHFVFMGDSRVRQHFYNFAAMMPDYDQIREPTQVTDSFYDDIDITSDILRVRLSFKWRPLIDGNVTETTRQWATSKPSERPHLLFLGILVHHMRRKNNPDYRQYHKALKNYVPELGRLANVSRVIWLNQYPVDDKQDKIHDNNADIYSLKIYNYGKGIRHLLENENSRIRIWDSSNPLVEEYIRSCDVLKRDEIIEPDSRPYLFKDAAHVDCNDFIHPGNSVLLQATNLLYNDICNNV